MYEILVFYADGKQPAARHSLVHGADVVAAIPRILKEHPTCERLEAHAGGSRLFSVDGKGAPLPK